MWRQIGEYIWRNAITGRRIYGEFKSSEEVVAWLREVAKQGMRP